MSIGTDVIEGGKVTIKLQMENRDGTKFPRAIIYDRDDAIIATRELTHTTNGRYLPDTDFFMPALPFIYVQYLIYDDSGRTIFTQGQGVDVDDFKLALAITGTGSGLIIGTVSSETIIGIVTEDQLSGELTEEGVLGELTVDEQEQGVIVKETIEGEIND